MAAACCWPDWTGARDIWSVLPGASPTTATPTHRTHPRTPPGATPLCPGLGYEDLNDHDRLAARPAPGRRCRLCDPAGENAPRAADRGKALAGKSTLNRLELTRVGADQESRYKKIVAHTDADRTTFVDALSPGPRRQAARTDRPGPRRHRRPRARPSAGPLLPRLLRPLLLPAALYFLRRPSALAAKLRPATSTRRRACSKHVAEDRGADPRSAWPTVKIVIRGDSGFCRDHLMDWCEANGVDYIFGPGAEQAAGEDHRRRNSTRPGGVRGDGASAARVFKDIEYRTLKSWSRAAPRGRQGRASDQGSQPALRGDVAAGGADRGGSLV